jgi:hypothetical protein
MSQYVRLGKSGRFGRLARAHRVSSLGRARISGGPGILSNAQRALINQRLSRLGYGYTAADYAPDQYSSYANPSYSAYGSVPPLVSASPSAGGLTPAEAQVLTAGIQATGTDVKQAIIGTPTVTYNPVTGAYQATGGASFPAGIATAGLSTEIESYLPLILLAGGAILLFSMVGRK